MDADQLLQSLALSLGVPDLRFDGNGCARLAIDGAPSLNFERNATGGLHLYSVIGKIPAKGREAVFAQMLQGNLFGASTAGASLAVDELFGEVLLCATVDTNAISAPAFTTQVEAFVAAAEDWQDRLENDTAPSAAELSSAPRMMDHFLRG